MACHALAARVRLYLGAGYAMPTQLVLVPMLFVVAPAAVPALVACGLVAARLPELVRGRAHPERLVTSVADAWHAVGPSLVMVLAGSPAPGLGALPVVALALAAQCATDLAAASLRERLGRGIAPALQAQEIGLVYAIDVCLTPLGVLVAVAAAERPLAGLVVVLPLLALLAGFASDRRARIEEVVSRADLLREERARLDRAIRRVGAAFASGLDRRALADLALGTATEALDADAGRTTLAAAPPEHAPAAPELEPVLAAAERAARERGEIAEARDGGHVALAHPLGTADRASATPDVLTVARRDRPFSDDERALFGYLAQQAVVAMENVRLHDELRRQATVDELTDLANHRRFREALATEVERTRRAQRPLALVLLDIDDFKRVNDTHGHPQGDLVLRRVADAVRWSCRATDEPARYGGEELAILLPDTGVDGARALAEKVRRTIAALEVPLPGGPALRVTVSVGVAVLDGDDVAEGSELVAAADAALYDAKRSGKNRTVVATRPEGPPVPARGPKRFRSGVTT